MGSKVGAALREERRRRETLGEEEGEREEEGSKGMVIMRGQLMSDAAAADNEKRD